MLRNLFLLIKYFFTGVPVKVVPAIDPSKVKDVVSDVVDQVIEDKVIDVVIEDIDGGKPHPSNGDKPAHTPRFLWCIDNGHGKLQAGKRSPQFVVDGQTEQFYEWEFNLDVVLRICSKLDSLGIKYYHLVPDAAEQGSFLAGRVGRANAYDSDLPKLFLSVHSNAAGKTGTWTTAEGNETWYFQGSAWGQRIAEVFQRHLAEASPKWSNRGLKVAAANGDTRKYVLQKTEMPAILTENGFFNNKEQVRELRQDEVRERIADAHVKSILEIETSKNYKWG